MEFLIGIIIVGIILLLVSMFFKKKYYRKVDQLESWKVDMMNNQSILHELSKVKSLKMTGQTEQLFEKWRRQWEDIVAVELPEVEEMLFDAENRIDRFLFHKANAIFTSIEEILNQAEDKVEKIKEELDELVGSEEQNRREMEELSVGFHECKKKLLTQRHQFGPAVVLLEERLADIETNFQAYDEKTNNGDYLEAREIVLNLMKEYDEISSLMETIPSLLQICKQELPQQLKELKDGYYSMSDQGFFLEHLELEGKIISLEKNLIEWQEEVGQLQIDAVHEHVEKAKDEINELYDLLEEEVHGRHYFIQNKEKLKESFYSLKGENESIKVEVDFVKQGYMLQEEELQMANSFELRLKSHIHKFDSIQEMIDGKEIPFSLVSKELQTLREELEKLEENQRLYNEKLQALRQDELTARDKIVELKKSLQETKRKIAQSNLPGLPSQFQDLIQQASGYLANVEESLQEKPLNISVVNHYLENAIRSVEHFVTSTNEIIEQVRLAEKVIQYGNRYRSRYPSVKDGLSAAEAAFRSYEYQAALEQAAAAVEAVEPGALKKIEQWIYEGA
ncbi:hypothetical protein Q75_11680 [Bacillus coahuilensis p1.1.43]|uniref:Septation ring formation regulator EzrA n=1 Tax=Bacillus coahuilensis p1.1.43 TaxID=1150625 RepID=A0A147K6H3_9BACI|nr:septation ring formation regulator EzrA [Bacillus coahuilensis]KUP05500.1 hypothetical protein Q75_11680 [Bacillus coahuilensis p1.1.43]